MRIVQGDNVSTIAVISAAFILAGSLSYAVLVPKAKLGKKYTDLLSKPHMLIQQAAENTARYEKLKVEPTPHLFIGSAEEATPDALRRLASIGKESHVLVNGFRPQKAQDTGDVQILPYYMTVIGSFDGISKFLQTLSTREPKLAITLIQIAAPETGNSQVTASINVVGYLKPDTSDSASDDISGKTASKVPASTTVADLGSHSGTGAKPAKPVTHPITKSSQSLGESNKINSSVIGAKSDQGKGIQNG